MILKLPEPIELVDSMPLEIYWHKCVAEVIGIAKPISPNKVKLISRKRWHEPSENELYFIIKLEGVRSEKRIFSSIFLLSDGEKFYVVDDVDDYITRQHIWPRKYELNRINIYECIDHFVLGTIKRAIAKFIRKKR